MNRFVAGLVAGIPLALIGVIAMLIWGRGMVASLKTSTDTGMTDDQWFYLMLGGIAAMPFLYGLISALIYGWIGSPQWFLGVALGLAVLMTVAAIATRTPLMGVKIVANFAVALAYGILIPLLTGGWA